MEKRISQRNFRRGYHVFKGPENCSGLNTDRPVTRKPVENVLTCFSKRAYISRENSTSFSLQDLWELAGSGKAFSKAGEDVKGEKKVVGTSTD